MVKIILGGKCIIILHTMIPAHTYITLVMVTLMYGMRVDYSTRKEKENVSTL